MSQLSVADQHEVDSLNDDIRRLTQENKEAFSTRMRLEAEKNKLENLLTNNLMRRKDELMQVQYKIGYAHNLPLCDVTEVIFFVFCKRRYLLFAFNKLQIAVLLSIMYSFPSP
jgi:hypothetical protein